MPRVVYSVAFQAPWWDNNKTYFIKSYAAPSPSLPHGYR
jgi:hypothetical protein